jgi:hypothetical protein
VFLRILPLCWILASFHVARCATLFCTTFHMKHLVFPSKRKRTIILCLSRNDNCLDTRHFRNFTSIAMPMGVCRNAIVFLLSLNINKGKGKAVPLQAWSGPDVSRKLRFPDFMNTAQDGGKVVSLKHRPPLPPGNTPGTNFC